MADILSLPCLHPAVLPQFHPVGQQQPQAHPQMLSCEFTEVGAMKIDDHPSTLDLPFFMVTLQQLQVPLFPESVAHSPKKNWLRLFSDSFENSTSPAFLTIV